MEPLKEMFTQAKISPKIHFPHSGRVKIANPTPQVSKIPKYDSPSPSAGWVEDTVPPILPLIKNTIGADVHGLLVRFFHYRLVLFRSFITGTAAGICCDSNRHWG